jgi:hypothetical protein
MFTKLQPMTKIAEPVRSELVDQIMKKAEQIQVLGYRFDFQKALDEALQKILREQAKFIQKIQTKQQSIPALIEPGH